MAMEYWKEVQLSLGNDTKQSDLFSDWISLMKLGYSGTLSSKKIASRAWNVWYQFFREIVGKKFKFKFRY